MRVLPEGQSESAADCSDEKVRFCLLQGIVLAQTSQKRCCGLREFEGTTAALAGQPFSPLRMTFDGFSC